MTAADLIRAGEPMPARPWPRYLLPPDAWRALAEARAVPGGPAFLGLWADAVQVHALFLDEGPLLASVPVEAGLYAALSQHRPGAAAFERMVADLWGHQPAHAADTRPLLDHGHWPVLRPLSPRPVPQAMVPPEPPEFLDPPGAGLHRLQQGPVRAGIADPVYLRLAAAGTRVVRLEARTGYAHRGVLAAMRGAAVPAAAAMAARLNAEAAVAHQVAFARAAEAALGMEAPPSAHALRAVMAELERIAIHLATLAATCRTAGHAPAAQRIAWHREAMLRAAAAAFGHRMMMDAVHPGGASELQPGGGAAIQAALGRLVPPDLVPQPVLDRLEGIGTVPLDLMAALHPRGPNGRAAGLDGDARLLPGYPPYGGLVWRTPLLAEGDAAARTMVRVQEVARSAALLHDLLGSLPAGSSSVALAPGRGEGLGCAEGPHGAVWHWLRLEGGAVAANFALDPAWQHWGLAEAAAAGASLDDVPLILASIGAAAAGMDL